jgi:predicted CopG family antitoxin
MEKKTIVVSLDNYERLEKLKVVERDTMNAVVGRLLDEHDKNEEKKE